MKEKAGEPGSETRTSLGRPGGRVQTVTAAGGPQGRRGGHSKMLVAPPLSSDSAADISLKLTARTMDGGSRGLGGSPWASFPCTPSTSKAGEGPAHFQLL